MGLVTLPFRLSSAEVDASDQPLLNVIRRIRDYSQQIMVHNIDDIHHHRLLTTLSRILCPRRKTHQNGMDNMSEIAPKMKTLQIRCIPNGEYDFRHVAQINAQENRPHKLSSPSLPRCVLICSLNGVHLNSFPVQKIKTAQKVQNSLDDRVLPLRVFNNKKKRRWRANIFSKYRCSENIIFAICSFLQRSCLLLL